MKGLYYVAAYNHRLNEWARFTVTAESAEQAEHDVALELSDSYRVRNVIRLCSTTDSVLMEI